MDPSAPRTLRTLIALHEESSGACVAYPVMRPEWAAFGDRDDVLTELRLFLEAQVRKLSAPEVAHLHLAPDVSGRLVPVTLGRVDLPHALRHASEVVFPCALIPKGDAHWVVILPLRHSFFVEPDEPLVPAIRAEAERLIRALEPTPSQWLDLLPAPTVDLELLEVQLAERDEERGAAAGLARKLTRLAERRAAREMLDHVGRPLHGQTRGAAPCVGREQEQAALGALLAAPTRSGVVLVGPEGSGKSAVFRSWLGSVGRDAERLVWATSGAQLIAGQSGLGQWQERLRRVLESASRLDAILYFDDLADLFGDKAGGFVDLASGVKPFVDDGRVRVVGELTSEVLDELRQRDPSFLALFHVIAVPAMSRDDAARALHAHVVSDTRRAGNAPDAPLLTPETERVILTLTERYVPYRAFPGKAVRLYEEVRAAARRLDPAGSAGIDPDQAYATFSVATGVPRFLLDPAEALGADRLRTQLRARVVGQEDAVERVIETLGVVKAALSQGEKPLASFLFVGPTGVGKTELARALAAQIFGDPTHLIRFDMSEYADPSAAERLIRGTDSREGALTREVRRKPFGVVLLDELEKADPSVFDLLLQVCGEGRLTDARGRTAYFHNVILIMTSNLGASHRARPPLGIGAQAATDGQRYEDAIEARFRPEFINRIDRIVPFVSLDQAQMQAVTRLMVAKLAGRRGFMDARASLSVTDAAIERLARAGHDPAYGARGMRRFLDEALAAPLARLVGELGEVWEGASLRVRAAHEPEERGQDGARIASRALGEWHVDAFRGERLGRHRSLDVIWAFARVRREADGWLLSPAIEGLLQRRRFLTMQLNQHARRARRNADPGPLAATLARDAGRLAQPLEALEAVSEEVRVYEELLLGALWSDSRDGGVDMALCDELRARLTKAAVRATMTAEPVDRATVYLQERDLQGAAAHWLRGLAQEARARSWKVWAFPARGTTGLVLPAGDSSALPFAPAIELHELVALLDVTPRAPMSVVLSGSGALIGNYLYAERGLHRVAAGPEGVERGHFELTFVIAEAPPSPATLARVAPAPFDPRAGLHLLPAARVVEAHRGLVIAVGGALRIAVEDYWTEIDAVVAATVRRHPQTEVA
jgi:ATP-dependent Clp protease ATP-binding subunit ClpC